MTKLIKRVFSNLLIYIYSIVDDCVCVHFRPVLAYLAVFVILKSVRDVSCCDPFFFAAVSEKLVAN